MTESQQHLCAYLAPVGFPDELEREINRHPDMRIHMRQDRLFIIEGPYRPLYLSQASWQKASILKFDSIKDGSRKLAEETRLWFHHPLNNFRRAELIGEQLKHVRQKTWKFLDAIPTGDFGTYSLLDENTLLAMSKNTHPLPLGEVQFVEDKIMPPSRAYLKLWELFTVHGVRPAAGEKVIDMGSCPGGWTWVLQTLGTHVTSVDKAPLEERIMKLPNITFRQESAFGLRPAHVGELDWFFSDIICYPHKLYELVERWHQSGLCRNFACTVKFQGTTDFEILDKFMALRPSRLIHLFNNKHEVTWVTTLPAQLTGQ